jgi:hypothetical protein
MGRKFDVADGGLRVCVSAVDEAWELWVCDRRHRLAVGGSNVIDEAEMAYRGGTDPVAAAGRLLADQIERGLFALPTAEAPASCPHH